MESNPFDFTGRSALVTGCGSAHGIGFASAALLARLGATVAISSTTARIEKRADEILVNAAGMVQTGTEARGNRFARIGPEDWLRELDLNLHTARSTQHRPRCPRWSNAGTAGS